MKLKKIISLLCVVALTASMLAGCGSNETKEGETVTLKWLVPSDAQDGLSEVMSAANEISREKIGVEVDMVFIDNAAYQQKVNLMMTSGEQFDLVWTGFMNEYQKVAQDGGLKDVTEIVEKVKMNEVVPQYFIDSAKIDGRIYGIPNQQVICNPYALMVFTDLLEKYDFDPSTVKHIEDIEPFLEKIKANEPNMIPYDPDLGAWTLDYKDVEIGTNVTYKKGLPDGKLYLVQETEEYKNGMKKLNEWYNKGYIRKDVLSAGDTTAQKTAGKYAVWNSTWAPGSEATAKKQYGRDVTFIKLETPYVSRRSPLLTMTSVSATTKDAQKAVELIKLANSDKEFFNLLAFGIKDNDYTLDSENKVVVKDDADYKMSAWKLGNVFNAYLTTGQDDDTVEQTIEMNNTAETSVLLGFVPKLTSLSSKVSQVQAVNDEYAALKKGAVNPDGYYQEYIKRLNEAGQQEILKELQKQIDEFMKTK